MSKKTVMEFSDDSHEEKLIGPDFANIISDTPESSSLIVPEDATPPKKRGPGRPSKKSNANTYTDEGYSVVKKKQSTEKKFEQGYTPMAKMLYSAIAQTDSIYSDIGQELEKFKASRSYGGRNRMMSMSNFMSTQAAVVNTKINAVRELDTIRHKINDLVLKKTQMDKDTNEENSDKTVMDAYYAMINATNYGLPQHTAPLSPASINTGVAMNGSAVSSQNVVFDSTPFIDKNGSPVGAPPTGAEMSFQNYKENLTPIQRKMILDKDPNIKTVVVYNQTTGEKYFDVINVQTGQSVPGVQRPAEFLLDNMRVDARNGIASNSNINKSFPLVIIGTSAADEL